MKRFLLILVLCIVVASFVGCSSDDDPTGPSMTASYNATLIQSTYFDSDVVETGDGYYIVRDLNTDVLYLVVKGYRSATMTPIYDSDGSIRTYSEFCKQEVEK